MDESSGAGDILARTWLEIDYIELHVLRLPPADFISSRPT